MVYIAYTLAYTYAIKLRVGVCVDTSIKNIHHTRQSLIYIYILFVAYILFDFFPIITNNVDTIDRSRGKKRELINELMRV